MSRVRAGDSGALGATASAAAAAAAEPVGSRGMDSTGVSGSNIDGTKGKIEDMLDTICTAFSRQLDNLYGEEALDISADITVMEQIQGQLGHHVQFFTHGRSPPNLCLCRSRTAPGRHRTAPFLR